VNCNVKVIRVTRLYLNSLAVYWSCLLLQLGKQGENIEAVVRLESADDIPRLEDADGRQFILSRGQDSTRPLEDLTLLLVIYIIYLTLLLVIHIIYNQ